MNISGVSGGTSDMSKVMRQIQMQNRYFPSQQPQIQTKSTDQQKKQNERELRYARLEKRNGLVCEPSLEDPLQLQYHVPEGFILCKCKSEVPIPNIIHENKMIRCPYCSLLIKYKKQSESKKEDKKDDFNKEGKDDFNKEGNDSKKEENDNSKKEENDNWNEWISWKRKNLFC